jgi:threonine aldolase
MVGKEAALFVPSGTMANQLALRLLGRAGTVVLAGRRSHVVAYENGAAGVNGAAQLLPLADDDGVIGLDAVREAIGSAHHHQPPVSLLCVEDTHMAAGGRCLPPGRLAALAALDVPVHLDGARLFNASVATGRPASKLAGPATTVMCCLSKGLGAPIGSLLAGPADLIDAARSERARLGGAMRQAGIVAAAGIVALETMVDRLADDHANARLLADGLRETAPQGSVGDVQTNMVVFDASTVGADAEQIVGLLRAEGVLAGPMSATVVRLVTHVDVDAAGVARAVDAFARVMKEASRKS